MSTEVLRSEAKGRVGTCTKGPAAGQRVLIVPETREPWWQIWCEPPWENFVLGHSQFSFDNYIEGDDAVEQVIGEWGVVFLPESVDAEVERRIFDVRKNFI